MKVARIVVFVMGLMIQGVAVAQQSTWAGKYEGTAKGPDGEVKLVLQLTEQGGKFSGSVTSPRATYNIARGTVADGVLTLETEPNGTAVGKLTLKQKDGALVGEFSADGRTGPIEFRKAAPDEITGEWDAIADAQGQPVPFTLTLKLEGEKISGTSASQLGNSNISSGSWKDGKLTVILEGGSGQIGLVATMIEGKLSGDYDFAGQLQGKWVAIRKK